MLVVLKHISTDCGIDPQTGVQHHLNIKYFGRLSGLSGKSPSLIISIELSTFEVIN